MSEKPPKLTKQERDLFKLLEATYAMVHFADFVMDKNSQQVLYWITSGNPLFMTAAAEYLEKRHSTIDHMLVEAGKRKKNESTHPA